MLGRSRRKPVITLLRRKPRVVDVRNADEFAHWLADTIVGKAAQEGSDCAVVVEAGTPDPRWVRVTCHTGEYRLSVTERKG